MARPRLFDEATAIEAAMRVFWSNGYAATSTEQLCEATGLGRSSIYNTFVSKHELFRKALGHYIAIRDAMIFEVLDSTAPIRQRLGRLIQEAIDEEADSDRHGCLVVNTAVEMSTSDDEIDAMLRHNLDQRLSAIQAAIAAAQRHGEFPVDKDPSAVAHFIVATISGIRVIGRSGGDRVAMQGVGDTAMAAL